MIMEYYDYDYDDFEIQHMGEFYHQMLDEWRKFILSDGGDGSNVFDLLDKEFGRHLVEEVSQTVSQTVEPSIVDIDPFDLESDIDDDTRINRLGVSGEPTEWNDEPIEEDDIPDGVPVQSWRSDDELEDGSDDTTSRLIRYAQELSIERERERERTVSYSDWVEPEWRTYNTDRWSTDDY